MYLYLSTFRKAFLDFVTKQEAERIVPPDFDKGMEYNDKYDIHLILKQRVTSKKFNLDSAIF